VEQGLPPQIADSVKAAAFDDFLAATHIASLISLAVVVIAAIVVAVGLPTITPPERKVLPEHPADDTDALVLREMEDYRTEAAEEYRRRDGERPSDATQAAPRAAVDPEEGIAPDMDHNR
jgi:hypothetical protein